MDGVQEISGLASSKVCTQLSEFELTIRDTVRRFAEEELRPKVREMDERASLDYDLVQQLFQLGVMGIEVPESLGGLGGNFFSSCLAVQELARVDGSLAVLVDVQNTLVINAISRWATEEQKKKYLSLLSSRWVGSYALSESTSGSDAFSLQCQARKVEGGYILRGHKLWITNAYESELFLVFATADTSLGYKGISAFLVEKSSPGFSVGKKEDKLGIRASSTAEIRLDDVFVPKAQLLGEEGKGYKIAIETLNEGRIGIGAQMLGISEGALEATLQYVHSREQFGKKLSEFQGVQFQLARMKTLLETSRLMVYHAARLKDAGLPFVTEAALAKLVSSESAETITSMAIDLHGGNGFTKEYPVEKFWRDAKIGQIYEGTTNMQLQTIAKKILQGS